MRYKFLSDDDGHTYLVPVEKIEAFEKWLAAGPYWENYTGEEFESLGRSLNCFSFTDPQEDHEPAN